MSKKEEDMKILKFVCALSFLVPAAIVSADSPHPTGPPLVWTDPLPELPNGCPAVYLPVVDARGNLYPSPFDAAFEGVRVVWLVE